jgi:copper resistance protein B
MSRALAIAAVTVVLALPARAADMGHGDDPAPTLFHAIRGELDYAPIDDGVFTWTVDGWIGGDSERVWVRSEGDIADGVVDEAELQLFYGWNVDPYWDVLVGVRQDFEPDGRTYLAASIVGLAPQFFETEASLFLSDAGEVSARFEQSVDLLLTQRLILQPHAELNVFAQDVAERNIGAGVSDIELGLQLRYEISRRFAPYVDAVWQRKLGETAGRARAAGEDVEQGTIRFGLRVIF